MKIEKVSEGQSKPPLFKALAQNQGSRAELPLQTQPIFSASCTILPGPNQPIKAHDFSSRKPPIVLTEATPITIETEAAVEAEFHYEILDVQYYMHNGKKKKKVRKRKVRTGFDSSRASPTKESIDI